MKKLILILVFLLGLVSSASASSFTDALAKTSGLVPASKPFSGRAVYTTTGAYTGLKTYADALQAQVVKKITYKANTTKKVKGVVSKKVKSSADLIQKRQDDSELAIQSIADARLGELYEAADLDYGIALDAADAAYEQGNTIALDKRFDGIDAANAVLESTIIRIKKKQVRVRYPKKARPAVRKKIKRAAVKKLISWKRSAIKAAQAKAETTKQRVQKEFDTTMEQLDADYAVAESAADAVFDQNTTKADGLVETERVASIAALAAATKKELTIHRIQESRLTGYLKKLSRAPDFSPTPTRIDEPKKTGGKKKYCSQKANRKKKACSKKKAPIRPRSCRLVGKQKLVVCGSRG